MLKRAESIYGLLLLTILAIGCKKEKAALPAPEEKQPLGLTIEAPGVNCRPSGIDLRLANDLLYYPMMITNGCDRFEQIKYEGDRPVSAKGYNRGNEPFDCKFEYDANGNLIRLSQYEPGAALPRFYTRFTWPPGTVNSMATEMEWAFCERKGIGAKVLSSRRMQFDYQGRLTQIIWDFSGDVAYKSYQYDPVGNLKKIFYNHNDYYEVQKEYSNYDNKSNPYVSNRVWALLSGIHSKNNPRSVVSHGNNMQGYFDTFIDVQYSFNSFELMEQLTYTAERHLNGNITHYGPIDQAVASYPCLTPIPHSPVEPLPDIPVAGH